MDEIIFVVEEAPEGGYTARALGASIFTEADDLADLQAQVRDAVRCHFDQGQGPRGPSAACGTRRCHRRMRPSRDVSGDTLAKAPAARVHRLASQKCD